MLKRIIHGGLQRAGYKLVRWPPPGTGYPTEATPKDMALIERCLPFTMGQRPQLWGTLISARYIDRAGIPGAVVECGVWRGGHMMVAALACRNRDLWLYDTFAGMPEPTELDRKTNGEAARIKWEQTRQGDGSSWCLAPLDEVRSNMASTGYPPERLHFIQGKVEDNLQQPPNLPQEIALLRVDTDWYESTKAILDILYPRVVPGGVLILDDYGAWQGARQAADECLADAGLLLCPIGGPVRVAIKR